MKKILPLLFCLFGYVTQAQYTISGSFSPAKDYTWLIAYRINPGTQGYIADTAIKEGKFTLNIPQNAQSGTYRLVYAVPQEEFYFDVIYNGKESIELTFDIERGVSFKTSKENKIFNAYFREINGAKQRFIDFYRDGKTNTIDFKKLAKELNEVQTAYEESTSGMLVHHFITANTPYIPSSYEFSEKYWQNKKDQYFKYLDFLNPVLQSSAYLTDKLTNYVFTAISAKKEKKADTEKVFAQNIQTVNEKLKGTDSHYQLHIYNTLWSKAAANRFNETSDYIFNTYLRTLSNKTGNQKVIQDIELHNRLRIGAIAPDIVWKEGDTTKELSLIKSADCYVLIFWSSTCSHCLKELPALHKKLMENSMIKVIAVGLEDNDTNWKKESAKLVGFEHAIALGKWESDYAKLYDIHQTPTYFILDKNKRIIAKPGSDKEVIEFLEGFKK
ncbi:MAG: AhpC/TSA family protein [Maribacter sp.]|nr:AhpC/TSA family protein [Maribacter sp.]